MKPHNYKDDEFIHLVYKGSKKDEMIEIPFRDIESMDLNKRGTPIPYTMSNVVNLERYMLLYWSPIIGSDSIILFLHLWEYCDRKSGVDICYPKINELALRMGKTAPTIRNILKKLEENNFIITIHRLNRLHNNKETSPIYKLRQTIPLISKEQYLKLPESLQKRHDDYMERFATGTDLEWFTYDSNETIESLKANGDKIISSKSREEIKAVLKREQEEEFIMANLGDDIKNTLIPNKEFLELLMDYNFSKASAEIYFQNSIVLYDSSIFTVHIITQSSSQKEFLENGLNEYQQSNLRKALDKIYEESIYDIKYFTAEQYIMKILKG
ncbi:helix-turn-helix domain-containing protein [Cytobacillus horneckiae]|uniref:Helix-turn-helix domain-containing protein n=1 Tax=Cytobacillus horneckiae TaxID=549687 RepID=A0A2N0ZB07_9BACI|nr:helix-turn-helix domain-containing protein [Cytobacillus horneckiae]MEC1158711.1 helix-turn-helix domain-containing protein [Cytobacillus horneckiae]NRG47676.1 helix-turn-helix domain-containing protein [Bacillus sp. CRN 9]PKG26679.1 helix-turn-helix domain-containing protein [Cytobacillus horneckiae]